MPDASIAPPNRMTPRPPRRAAVSCSGPRCSTPTTCAGRTPGSPTRSSSATTAPRSSCWSGSTRGASRSPSAWPPRSSRSRASTVPVGALDVAFYRDDIGLRPVQPLGPTEVPVDVTDTVGRARRRRAVHRPHGPGRPRRAHRARAAARGAARGAVDRGHRELPIRADFVGQEPADEARRGRACPARRGRRRRATASSSGARVGRGRGMKHLLSIDDLGRDGIVELLRPRRVASSR